MKRKNKPQDRFYNSKLNRYYRIFKITETNVNKIYQHIWFGETPTDLHFVPIGKGKIGLPNKDKLKEIPVLLSLDYDGNVARLGKPGDYVWIPSWLNPCIILTEAELKELLETDDPDYEGELYKNKLLELIRWGKQYETKE